MTDITLPAALPAATDWTQTFQNIVAYGAGRLFDSAAIEKIYKSTGTPMLMDTDGTLYPAGTVAPSALRSGGGLASIPMAVWLVGAGLLAFVILKD